MKRFLNLCFWGTVIPLVVLAILYVWADPFTTVHPFDIHTTKDINREYRSTELFLHNIEQYHYNSYIFCSSKGSYISVKQWESYLPTDACVFMFQAWSESVTGIERKITYIDSIGEHIDNALVMIDYPFTEQLPTRSITMKHYLFTNQSHFTYNLRHWYNFIQEPKAWIPAIKEHNMPSTGSPFDTIHNAIYSIVFDTVPIADSLCNKHGSEREKLIEKVKYCNEDDIKVADMQITPELYKRLAHIEQIFKKQHTDYRIVICPLCCYLQPIMNPADLQKLCEIFGTDKVYNYASVNSFTTDIYDYADENHFGYKIGYLMLKDIYE